MRDYGKVFSRIWASPDFRALSEDGRTLVLYLLTCEHGTIAGVFRVPDGYASEDLQWSCERVSGAFMNLASKGFANRCGTTYWVWIRKFMEWNPPENPNQRKAAAKVAALIPDQCAWKQDFMRVCGPLMGIETPPNIEPLQNPCATLSESVSVAVTVEKNTPQPPDGGQKPGRKRKSESSTVGLKAWLETLKARSEKPIPEGDPVFAYAERVGLPPEFLALAWSQFKHRYGVQHPAKRYSDWRRVFRNAVEGNWLKLWWLDPTSETYALTTTGQQARRDHDGRAAA